MKASEQIAAAVAEAKAEHEAHSSACPQGGTTKVLRSGSVQHCCGVGQGLWKASQDAWNVAYAKYGSDVAADAVDIFTEGSQVLRCELGDHSFAANVIGEGRGCSECGAQEFDCAARAWLKDLDGEASFGYENQAEYEEMVDGLSADGLKRALNRHYAGGSATFLAVLA